MACGGKAGNAAAAPHLVVHNDKNVASALLSLQGTITYHQNITHIILFISTRIATNIAGCSLAVAVAAGCCDNRQKARWQSLKKRHTHVCDVSAF
jgi:hypothetical protein